MVTEPLESVHQLSAEARGALGDLVAALSENKKLLGVRYGEWAARAPTLEASVASAAMAQDELGHARISYGLLDEIRGQRMRDDTGWEMEGTHLFLLERPFQTWMEFVACNALVDPALTVVVEAAAQSRYVPLRQRTRKMVQEERFHTLHGRTWFRRLATSSPAIREGLEAATAQMLPEILCWFGPQGDLRLLQEAGVVDGDGEALRARYLQDLVPVLSQAAFPVPAKREGKQWVVRVTLPWDRWDGRRRRLRTSEGDHEF